MHAGFAELLFELAKLLGELWVDIRGGRRCRDPRSGGLPNGVE
jgi:hypothetical protein